MHTVVDTHKSHQNYSKNIYASSPDNAKLHFKDLMRHEIEDPEQYRMIRTLDDVQFKQVISETSLTATQSKNMLMKRGDIMNYSFITEDRTKLNELGFCVVDNFLATYSPLIKKLNLDYLTDLCYNVRCEVKPDEKKQISSLDKGIDDDEYEDRPAIWTIEDGITPKMLLDICKHLDISHYAF